MQERIRVNFLTFFLVTCMPTRIEGRPLVRALFISELQLLLLSYMNKRILAQYLNFHAETQLLHTAHKAASICRPYLVILIHE